MSIADKITSITGHLTDDYIALEQLGVSVEDRNIENIKDMANQIYAKFPKTDYEEGSNIILSNTLKGKLDFEDGIVGIGDTSQIQYEGYNELNIYAVHPIGYSETVSGVTIKYNNDGSVTATGTATADINYFLGSRASLGDMFNGTYYLSGCKTGSNTTYYLSMWAEGIGVYPQTTTEVATNKTSGVNWNIVIVVKSGASVNYTFYPMMSKTSGKSFEPFVGNSPSPNPSYPQDIEVVRGKNILNFSIVGKVPSVNGGGLVDSPYGATTEPIQIYGEDYALSYSATGAKPYVFYYGDNNTFLGSANQIDSGYTISTSIYFSSAKYIRIRTDNFSVLNNTNTQLEKGSATSYLPYNTIEEVVSGKNLCDKDNEIRIGGSVISGDTTRLSISLKEKLKANTKYTLVTNLDLSSFYYAYVLGKNVAPWTLDNQIFDSGWQNVSHYTYETTQECYMNIPIRNSSNTDISISDVSNYWFMLYEGEYDSNITYEPYQTPQTYQLSLGEYEFAKIGNYVDTIEYDVDEDKVYKNEKIGKYIFTGNEDSTYYDSGGNRFVINDLVNSLEVSGRQQIYSNRYKFISSGSADYGMFAFYNTVHQVFIYHKDYTSPSDLLTYYANNNTYFYYIRNNLNKIEITGTLADQIKALYYSHSFTGTTIIEINGQLPLIIKVRALKGE